jgi:hypothetical protein
MRGERRVCETLGSSSTVPPSLRKAAARRLCCEKRLPKTSGLEVAHVGTVRSMSILWIILIVILVLALLGFFSRGYW